jgi:cation:H+ antiporter
MSLLLVFPLLIAGIYGLIKGSDLLVEGASSIAKRFNISSIVIGLTVVSFGTSAPEFVVSISSALQGSTDIALANVVGSNISNILLILGLCGIIYPVAVKSNTIWKEIPFSLATVIVLVILGLETFISQTATRTLDLNSVDALGVLTRSSGIILLIFFVVFLYYNFGIAKMAPTTDEIKTLTNSRSIIYTIVGLILLAISSRMVVDNAIIIAKALSISETVVGLTVVAIGTSLPELFTSVTATIKKQSDIAVGNAVGSNIFNATFILGSTLLIKPIPVSGQNIADILFLMIITIIFFISIFVFSKHKIGRIEGITFLVIYVAYTVFLLNRG